MIDARYEAARLTDDPSLEKAMRRIVRCDQTGCWLYNGWLQRGYPTIIRRQNGAVRYHIAHRFFYEKLVEPIPPGKVLMHQCDTRNCCNPSHLSVGTQSENMRDMWAKGRGRTRAKVVHRPKAVREAATVLIAHGALKSELARSLMVSPATMTRWSKSI